MNRTESVVVAIFVQIIRFFLEGGGTEATRIPDLVRARSVGMFRAESLAVSLLVVVIRLFLEGGGAVATRIPDSGRDTFSFPGKVRLPESISVTFTRHPLETGGSVPGSVAVWVNSGFRNRGE